MAFSISADFRKASISCTAVVLALQVDEIVRCILSFASVLTVRVFFDSQLFFRLLVCVQDLALWTEMSLGM